MPVPNNELQCNLGNMWNKIDFSLYQIENFVT